MKKPRKVKVKGLLKVVFGRVREGDDRFVR
jgi:hypothetical protein